jgi:4-alpha-glucanotransferase
MTDAVSWGLQPKYLDFRGDEHKVSDRAIARVLEALDARPDPPTRSGPLVIRRGSTKSIIDAVEIKTEDGGSVRLADGRLPPDLPLGYHSLIHRSGRATKLVVSPGSCFLPKDLFAWGWGVQLYATRSRRSWGIGDLGDLETLSQWASRLGARVLLLNPLHAARPSTPQEPSPYFPSSRCFKNLLYLDIDAVPGSEVNRDAIRPLAEKARRLNTLDVIDRDSVYRIKLEALERLWPGADRSTEAFKHYCARRGELLADFATYMALAEEHGGDRRRWPSGYQHPRSGDVVRWRESHDERVDFHMWVQWLLDQQVERASQSIDLIHDVAIGIDPAGADSWLWQDTLASGVTVGAPPDEFNSLGQNWGMQPFDPWKLRSADYEPFIQTIRACMRAGSGIRIDHIMWLFRLWWIPDGFDPGDGVYVTYPHHDLLDILALESQRAHCYVVGEDLGTVEAIVREEMLARDMLSYRLMWFEESPPAEYPELALAAVTSHDLPTIAGLWTGTDLDEQERLHLKPDVAAHEAVRAKVKERLRLEDDTPVGEVIPAVYRSLSEAPSRIVIAVLEDAVEVKRRPNLPGTVDRPNWSLPLPVPIEDLENHPIARSVADALSARR